MKKIYKKTIIICIFVIIIFSVFGFVVERNKYPLKYKEIILRYSHEYNVDPFYVYAIIKTESNFNEKAKSKVGAIGLMQIMPYTGRYIAEKLKIEEFDLYNVNTNIMFGIYYIKYLYGFYTDYDYVSIAYNAGEGKLNTWLNEYKNKPKEELIDDIPYKETRDYVYKVNKNFKKYVKLYSIILDKV